MAGEIGLSPGKLRQLMFNSPSPKKAPARVTSNLVESSKVEKENKDVVDLGVKPLESHAASGSTPECPGSARKVRPSGPASSKYSPLSSMGLYNLTKSPLVETDNGKVKRRQRRSEDVGESASKRRRVSKNLLVEYEDN